MRLQAHDGAGCKRHCCELRVSPQLSFINEESGTLMLWIEAQSTPVITLLVFGVCYMLAAAIFCLAAILSRRRVAQDLKAVAPVTLTPLGVNGFPRFPGMDEC